MVFGLGCGPTVGSGEGGGAVDSTSGADDGSASDPSATDPSVSATDPSASATDPTAATTVGTSVTSAETTTDPTIGDDVGTDDDPDGGGEFIMSPDGGVTCSTVSQCDVWAQDCMDGQKCMPWACGDHDGWNAARCSRLDDDPAQPGEACTVVDGPFSGEDDCQISSMCWNPDPESLVGECVAFCGGSEANPICENPATRCYLGYDGLVNLCLPACDPLVGDCDANEACMFAGDANDGEFVCMPSFLVGAQSYGDDCEGLVGCGTGLVCRPAADVPGCATGACCTMLGDLNAPPACPDVSQTCLPLYDEGDSPPSHEDTCYCGVEA